MQPTTYQPPQLFNTSGELIRDGAFGPETPFWNGVGTGMYDYLVNDLEYLRKVAEGKIIPVTSLPASGTLDKTYLVTAGANAGKCFIWTGTAWQKLSDEEAVDRAEAVAGEAKAMLLQVQALIAMASIDDAWDADTAYEAGNCVYDSEGVSYRCIRDNTGKNPATSPGYWSAISIVEQKTFEYDSNGDICPCLHPVASANWGIDENGDIYPII